MSRFLDAFVAAAEQAPARGGAGGAASISEAPVLAGHTPAQPAVPGQGPILRAEKPR